MTIKKLFLLGITSLLLFACRKDEQFTTDPGAKLTLTEDTVFFDTIFTTVGSVTKRFTVRNDNDQAIRVDVTLQGGQASPYRINVDGASGTSFTGVEILGKDSIFIFVEVTLGEGGVNDPFIFEDHILFTTNGNEQSVLLLAWGQDAHFIYPLPGDSQIVGLPRIGFIAHENQNVHWVNDKPYVIYGCYGVVDENATLTIDPGVRVYFHGPSSGLWVYVNGKITANGTVTERITFQGDRKEEQYADLPGQWDRIWINEGTSGNDNLLENVVIKNAFIGLQAQTFPLTPGQPTSANKLVLKNVRIQQCATAGLYSENYRVDAENLMVADAGQYCTVLTGGGEYHFDHASIGNYWSFGVRQDPAFLLTNKFIDAYGAGQVRSITSSTFLNGIIYGSNTNEFKLEIDGAQPTAFTFHHFLFRTDQDTNDGTIFTSNIHRNVDPGFVDPTTHDLHPTSSSQVKTWGDASSPVARDLDDVQYDGGGIWPIGCYKPQ